MGAPNVPNPKPMARSLVTLLTDLIDYAGLFPPAKLAMGSACEAYNRARVGEHEWALGRFVCPAAKLEELSSAGAMLMPGTLAFSGYVPQGQGGQRWHISALVSADTSDALEADLDRIDIFNHRHSSDDAGRALVDMIEVKVTKAEHIDRVMDRLPERLFPFFEIPLDSDARGFIAALAGEPCAAKIRTGGIEPGAFPRPDEIAAFLAACASADVAFKATAGLHHPIRAKNKLTYEPDSASCTMHGFLNLFIAAALLKARKVDVAGCVRILTDEDPASFAFSDDFLQWREFALETAQVAHIREAFALSFGSCSFDEPMRDLAALKLV